jgi:hypothetical protein
VVFAISSSRCKRITGGPGGIPDDEAQAIVDENESARIAGLRIYGLAVHPDPEIESSDAPTFDLERGPKPPHRRRRNPGRRPGLGHVASSHRDDPAQTEWG